MSTDPNYMPDMSDSPLEDPIVGQKVLRNANANIPQYNPDHKLEEIKVEKQESVGHIFEERKSEQQIPSKDQNQEEADSDENYDDAESDEEVDQEPSDIYHNPVTVPIDKTDEFLKKRQYTLIPEKDFVYLKQYEAQAVYAQKLQDPDMIIMNVTHHPKDEALRMLCIEAIMHLHNVLKEISSEAGHEDMHKQLQFEGTVFLAVQYLDRCFANAQMSAEQIKKEEYFKKRQVECEQEMAYIRINPQNSSKSTQEKQLKLLEAELKSIKQGLVGQHKDEKSKPAFEDKEAIAIAAACYYTALKFLCADYRIFEKYDGSVTDGNPHKIDKNHYYFHPDYVKKYSYQAIHHFQVDAELIYKMEKVVVEKYINWNILRLTMYDVQELYMIILKFRLQNDKTVEPIEGLPNNRYCPKFINFLIKTETIIEKIIKTCLLMTTLNKMDTTVKVVALMTFIISLRIDAELRKEDSEPEYKDNLNNMYYAWLDFFHTYFLKTDEQEDVLYYLGKKIFQYLEIFEELDNQNSWNFLKIIYDEDIPLEDYLLS